MSRNAAAAAAAGHNNDDTEMRDVDNVSKRDDGEENNEDDDDDEEEDDDESEAPPEPKILPKRTTRGTRVTDTHGEGDDDFWQQEFFADEAEQDNDYADDDAAGDDEPDVVDSDFDMDEGDDDDEEDGEKQVEKEKRGKKAGAYHDPRAAAAKRADAAKKAAATKAARKAAAAAASDAAAAASLTGAPGMIDTGAVPPVEVYYDDNSGFPTGQDRLAPSSHRRRPAAHPTAAQLAAIAAGRKSVRKSTVESSENLQKKEVALNEKRRKEAAKGKVKVVYQPWTQAEQLEHSLETEKENTESLAFLLKIEEERKKDLAPKVRAHEGDRIRVQSTRHLSYVSFTEQVPEYLLPQLPEPSRHDLRCVITQRPAKYIDRVTQLPYDSLDSYQKLKSLHPQQIHQLQYAIQQLQMQQRQQRAIEAGRTDALQQYQQQQMQNQFPHGSPPHSSPPATAVAAHAISLQSPQHAYAYAHASPLLHQQQLQQVPSASPPLVEESPRAASSSKKKPARAKAPPKGKK